MCATCTYVRTGGRNAGTDDLTSPVLERRMHRRVTHARVSVLLFPFVLPSGTRFCPGGAMDSAPDF